MFLTLLTQVTMLFQDQTPTWGTDIISAPHKYGVQMSTWAWEHARGFGLLFNQQLPKEGLGN